MKRILIVLVASAAILSGCVTEGQKVANDQMGQAAAMGVRDTNFMMTGMSVPDYVFNLADTLQRLEAIRVYFSDITKLSAANATGFGAPKAPKPYKPGDTEPIEKEASRTWYAVAGAAAMALAYRVGVKYLPSLAGPWGSLATAMVSGLAQGRTNAEAATTPEDAIKGMLKGVVREQDKNGVSTFAMRIMDKIETALDLEHKVKL
jgi:hypothetical protein